MKTAYHEKDAYPEHFDNRVFNFAQIFEIGGDLINIGVPSNKIL